MLPSYSVSLLMTGTKSYIFFFGTQETENDGALSLKPHYPLFNNMTGNGIKCHSTPKMLTECLPRDRNRIISSSFLLPFFNLFQTPQKRSWSLLLLHCSIFYPYTLGSENEGHLFHSERMRFIFLLLLLVCHSPNQTAQEQTKKKKVVSGIG